MTRRKILVADLLCGAGGSSTGCQRALEAMGLEMELVCVNHWPVAIDTHTRNHPQARHYVQDIATVRPHLLVPEGKLDLLMASPTCTHHSVARGGKPTSDQQRSDPWHIITWLTELRVKRMIIENVWEFCGWGPVDSRTGKPIKARKGEYFNAWIDTIRRLGFEPEWKKLNAADFGDATIRKRFILMARSDRKRLVWPVATHARKVDGPCLELFPGVKPWRPAREIIDWDIKGRSIFGRKKALAPKTLARIYSGAVKFQWPEPFLVILRNHMAAQSVEGPMPALAAGGNHVGLAQPIIMNGRKNNQAQDVSVTPLPALDTKGGVWVAEPFIATVAHGNEAREKDPNHRRTGSLENPLGAIYGDGSAYGVVEPFVLSQQNSGAPRSPEEPLPAILTGGAGDENHPGCARPMLVEPFMLSRLGGGRPQPVEGPTPTQVATHSHILIAPYYSSGSGETCTNAEVPLPVVTSKNRFGMVVPVTHSQGGNRASNTETDPVPTLTTAKGGEFAVVIPVTHAGGPDRAQDATGPAPLPGITGANRGELAFISAQFGEAEGQAPRVHDLDEPATTGMTLGHGALVEPTPQYDILFRMLEPHELAAAMGFTTDDATYEFAGNKTQKIKQIGNAVSVRKMRACVASIMADAAPRKAANPIAIAAE